MLWPIKIIKQGNKVPTNRKIQSSTHSPCHSIVNCFIKDLHLHSTNDTVDEDALKLITYSLNTRKGPKHTKAQYWHGINKHLSFLLFARYNHNQLPPLIIVFPLSCRETTQLTTIIEASDAHTLSLCLTSSLYAKLLTESLEFCLWF